MEIEARIVDNYISRGECENLINELDKLVNWKDVANIHNGRLSLPNSDQIFQNLLTHSSAWKKLYSRIYSQDFLNEVHGYFNEGGGIKKISFLPLLSKNKPKWFYRITNNSSLPLKFCSNAKLLAYLLLKIIYPIYIKSKIIIARMNGISLPVDMLFDVSKANHGYAREIHRDSDSRLYVFLIYLNELDSENGGGELLLYKKIDIGIPNPQPLVSDCELIKSLTPKSGRLVIFKNDDYAFHAVSEMQKTAGYRYFCYGGFTSLSGYNPFIKLTKGQFKTTFHQYL